MGISVGSGVGVSVTVGGGVSVGLGDGVGVMVGWLVAVACGAGVSDGCGVMLGGTNWVGISPKVGVGGRGVKVWSNDGASARVGVGVARSG